MVNSFLNVFRLYLLHNQMKGERHHASHQKPLRSVNFQMDDCQIEQVLELTRAEFGGLKLTPLADQPFIREHKSCMFSRDGVTHCLLALEQGGSDGVLIESDGRNYARRAAYLPGVRDIVNAQMERAADFILREGTGRMTLSELEERLGLTIREGNGLDVMLRAALRQRPEVAAAELHDGCIEVAYCQRLNSHPEETRGLQLKELLPLLKGGGTLFLRHKEADTTVLAENLQQLTAVGREEHAALLNARIVEICDTPEGTEVVLTDVAPEELVRFNEAHDAFMEAEQAMGPVM